MSTVAPIHAPRTALSSGAGLRARVTVAIARTIIAALAVATPILLLQAAAERRAIEERAGLATAAIAHIVEREALRPSRCWTAWLQRLRFTAATTGVFTSNLRRRRSPREHFYRRTTTSVRSSTRFDHSVLPCHTSGTFPPRHRRPSSEFIGTAGAFPGGRGVSLPEPMSSSSVGVSLATASGSL